MVPPSCLGDPEHIEKEKCRFMTMYQRKSGNGVKKWVKEGVMDLIIIVWDMYYDIIITLA